MAFVDFRTANELRIDCECPRDWVSVMVYSGEGSVRTRLNMIRMADAIRTHFGDGATACGFRELDTVLRTEVHLLANPADVVLELVTQLLDRIRTHAWLNKDDMLLNVDAVREEVWRNAKPSRRIAMLRAANAPVGLALSAQPPKILAQDLVLEGAAL